MEATDKLTAEEIISALNPPSDPLEEGYDQIELKLRAGSRAFNGYAPPNFWGSWVTVASHIGSVSYRISYSAVGSTLVVAQVEYWKGSGGGSKVVEDFRDTTSITTSNSVANVRVRFKGVPLGSAVRGSISP